MKKFGSPYHRIVLALLVGIVAVPITSTALFVQQEVLDSADISGETLRQRAMEDRRRLRAQRRIYWQAIEEFQNKEEQGIDVEKPDINDSDSIQRVFDATKEEEVHEAAPEVSSLTTDQLSTQDRGLLRRYTRAGFCPEVLRGFEIEGFYELCLSIVGSSAKKEPVTGLLNHNANLIRTLRNLKPSAQSISPFKLRMQMVDQANESGNRRDPGNLPGRPTTCVMNPDCLTPRYND